MTDRFQDRPEFLRGRVAEDRAARYLRRCGFLILPACDYSGPDGDRAPAMQGETERIVLPDLAFAKRGALRWAEVKAKSAPTFTIITQTWDHGISRRLWSHYKRIEAETGCEVWLFIVEECSQMLLAERLDLLGPGRAYLGNEMDRGGMLFWPRNAFSDRIQLAAIPGLFDDRAPMQFERPGRPYEHIVREKQHA